MTDVASTDLTDYTVHTSDAARRRLARRYAAERRFKALGLAAVLTAMAGAGRCCSRPSSSQAHSRLHAELRGAAGRALRRGHRSGEPARSRTSARSSTRRHRRGAAVRREPHRAPRGARLLVRRAPRSSCARRCSPIRPWSAARTPIALPVSDTVDLYLKGMIAEKDGAAGRPARRRRPRTSGEITVALDRRDGDADPPVGADRRGACRGRRGRARRRRSVPPALSERRRREGHRASRQTAWPARCSSRCIGRGGRPRATGASSRLPPESDAPDLRPRDRLCRRRCARRA